MTHNKVLKDIEKKLEVWRNDRHITKEIQRADLLKNIVEEIHEYLTAKTWYDYVDALCDIAILCLNVESLNLKQLNKRKYVLANSYYLASYITSKIYKYIKSGDSRHITHIVDFILQSLELAGVNPYKALLETIKEISLRTGEYVKEKQKFIKYAGAYTKQEAQELVDRLNDDYKFSTENESHWFFEKVFKEKGKCGYKTFKVVKWYKANYEICKTKRV